MTTRIILIITLIGFIASCTNPVEEKLNKINDLTTAVYDSTKSTINRDKAFELVKEYDNFVKEHKEEKQAADFLFKAGELSISLADGISAVKFFNRVYLEYPQYEKAPVSIFMKAFALETILNDKEQAKIAYEEFINKYPNHELAKDAKATLENIDIPLDELIKQFEQKQSSDSIN